MAGRIVNSAELGRIFGLTYPTVQKWIDEGMPYVEKPDTTVRGAHGWQFDCGEVLYWRVEQATKAGRLSGSRMSTLDQAKARKMEADAQQSELALATKLGQAVAIEDVVRVLGTHVSTARAKLLSIPSVYGPLLAVEETAAGCQALMETGIREALEELSGTKFDPTDFSKSPDRPEEFPDDDDAASGGPLGTAPEADDLGMVG